MNKTTYQKDDLIWEGTRRSEIYRDFFKRELSESARIALARDFFGLNFPADPNLGIDKIEEKIASGADPKEVHPYHGFFERKENPVILHPIPDFVYQYWYEFYTLEQDGTDVSTTHKKQFETWFYLFLNQTPGRILISIDPEFRDREIEAGIRTTKRKAVRERKSVGKDKHSSTRTYFPRDIGKYLGWLKIYDEIVVAARKMNFKVITDGPILTLPKPFSFMEMCPNICETKDGPKLESIRNSYRNAYNGAVELIKISPYIFFSNSRVQK